MPESYSDQPLPRRSFLRSASVAAVVSTGLLATEPSTAEAATEYIPLEQKGKESGVAALDAHGSVLPANEGTENVTVGSGALGSGKLSGEGRNAALGFEALHDAETVRDSVAIGWKAARLNKSGVLLIAIGAEALEESLASYNIAIGEGALKVCEGDSNIALGHGNMKLFKEGEYNVAVGQNALLEYEKGIGTLAVGTTALEKLKEGDSSTAIGTNSQAQATATPNTSVGFNALQNNKAGTGNTVVGTYAMDQGENPSNCTAIGHEALIEYSGSNSVAVGSRALEKSKTGEYNTALGTSSGTALETGAENTGAGAYTLAKIKTGNANTALGSGAGYYLIGASAGNVCIGNAAGPSAEAEHNNELFVSNEAGTKSLIWGKFSSTEADRELIFYTGKFGVFGHAAHAQITVAEPAAETLKDVYEALKETQQALYEYGILKS